MCNLIQLIVDIAVDWITDKVYWTKFNQIMVYDLKTGYTATVINVTASESGASFSQVVVDPSTRYCKGNCLIMTVSCIHHAF